MRLWKLKATMIMSDDILSTPVAELCGSGSESTFSEDASTFERDLSISDGRMPEIHSSEARSRAIDTSGITTGNWSARPWGCPWMILSYDAHFQKFPSLG